MLVAAHDGRILLLPVGDRLIGSLVNFEILGNDAALPRIEREHLSHFQDFGSSLEDGIRCSCHVEADLPFCDVKPGIIARDSGFFLFDDLLIKKEEEEEEEEVNKIDSIENQQETESKANQNLRFDFGMNVEILFLGKHRFLA